MSGKNINQQQNIICWTIFLATFVTTLLALITVLFPAFLIRSLGGIENYSGINSFETGIWTYSILITDSIIFGIIILYFKNKIPQTLRRYIRFILNFEINGKVAFLVMTVLLGVYVVFEVQEIFTKESWPDYYHWVKPILEKWTITDVFKGFSFHVKYFLITTSMNVFGNYKVIPFIASIALLILTYFFTTLISKKRFAGIVSVLIVLQSGTFLTYDTSTTYDNFWILFYLLSLYMICKKWPISPISFILSVFSKSLTIIYLPLTFVFMYNSVISKRKKIFLISTYGAVIIIGIAFVTGGSSLGTSMNAFEYYDFWISFNAFSYQLRYDILVLILLLPLIIGLGIAARRKFLHADSMMILIMGMILSQPITASFTNQASEPYRFIPLIVFCAVGVGVMFSKKPN